MSEGINAAQIAEIRQEIQEILRLLTEAEPKIQRNVSSLNEQIRLLTLVISTTRKFTGHDQIDEALAEIQRIAHALITLRLLYYQTMAEMGPVGAALITLSAIGTAASYRDMEINRRSRG